MDEVIIINDSTMSQVDVEENPYLVRLITKYTPTKLSGYH